MTYTNPVYPHDFPDPFVLRFNGRYYAYSTGLAGDGRHFKMLSSTDLVNWEWCGGVLDPLPDPHVTAYWAPEVAYSEGTFYFYYAAGNEENPDHHLRLATAAHPLGPWTDAGVDLTPREIFAIDAHPYRDPRDGQWYLFYARDNLNPPYAGTGLAVDRLVTMDRLEGKPIEVLRPHSDWQVFELRRAIKQGLDWYTIEGPFVLRMEGHYVCLYSGGRWENPNYGVGYALADDVLGPWTDDANAPGPTVLRTDPGKVIGPGHNSVVVGPDLVSEWIVYHGWDPNCTARYPRIDPLTWENGRPRCGGPSSVPQPAPRMPDVLEYLDVGTGSGREWEVGGEFVAETSVRFTSGDAVRIEAAGTPVELSASHLAAGEESVLVPAGFRPDVWHRLLVRRDRGALTVTLDEYPTVSVRSMGGSGTLSLGGQVEYSHVAINSHPQRRR